MVDTDYPKRLPDIIVNSVQDNFTLIPNDMLRDSRISWKAKGILSLLLSNKDNEWYSYKKAIQNLSTDGEMALTSGIKELENNGYLIRLKYRDKNPKKKQIRGSIWVCSDRSSYFNWAAITERLNKYGLEPVPNKKYPQIENLNMENPDTGIPIMRKPVSRVPYSKGTLLQRASRTNNTNNKQDQSDNKIILNKKRESENLFPSLYKLFYTKFLKKKRGVYINYLKKNINMEDMLSYQKGGYSDFAISVDVPAFIETSCRMLYHMQTHYSVQYTDSQLTDGFVRIYTLLSDNKVEMKTLSSVVDWYGIAKHREADFTTKIRTPLGLTIEGFTGLLESMQSFKRNKNKAERGPYAKKKTAEGPVPTRT